MPISKKSRNLDNNSRVKLIPVKTVLAEFQLKVNDDNWDANKLSDPTKLEGEILQSNNWNRIFFTSKNRNHQFTNSRI